VPDVNFWRELEIAVAQDEYLKPLVAAAKRLEIALAKLGVSTECMANLIDADMAAFLDDYFTTSTHSGVISGTPEFMSVFVRIAMETSEPHLQNPLDDLHSFWYTVLWAALYNPETLKEVDDPKVVRQVKRWRSGVAGPRGARASTVEEMSQCDLSSTGHSRLLSTIVPLLFEWNPSLTRLQRQFDKVFKGCTDSHEKLLVFYRFAYEGVAEYAELIYEERETLQAQSVAEATL
ncbi:hypothetical protein K466DRAFT_571313, partial [Polyporus arcularius HHB13444]